MSVERHGYYDEEFAYLESFKNKKIICLYWDFGRLRGYQGILDEVNPYDSIVIEGRKIKFLGERTAIKYILYGSKLIIYENNNIDDYTGHLGHFCHLIELQNKVLGYSVISENINEVLQKIKKL